MLPYHQETIFRSYTLLQPIHMMSWCGILFKLTLFSLPIFVLYYFSSPNFLLFSFAAGEKLLLILNKWRSSEQKKEESWGYKGRAQVKSLRGVWFTKKNSQHEFRQSVKTMACRLPYWTSIRKVHCQLIAEIVRHTLASLSHACFLR